MTGGKRATGRAGLDGYDQSRDASPQTREVRRFRDKDPAGWLPVLHAGGCWCGEEFGHDWPGKQAGEPHPRDWPGRVNGHPFRPVPPGGQS